AVGYQIIPPTASADQSLQTKSVYPLGRGMPDVQLLVLNQQQQLAGISEVGEIYVRSPHLALGYLGDEALTNVRFITNPFGGNKSDRLYRTGDLGRYRPDGVVEFAGRADRQIKIRGFRIEPGEIETALEQHPDLKEAVVTLTNAADNQNPQHYLIAYYIIYPASDLTVEVLRAFLKTRLPDHMIPTAFLPVESIPLTPNGKIDYRNLPIIDIKHIGQDKDIVFPQTPTQQHLAKIWQALLGLEQISIHDNFFELGGHSLLAIQLLTRLNQDFKQSVTLTSLFQAPTIAQLARVIDDNLVGVEHKVGSLVAIRKAGRQPPIFCIPGNLGNVFADLDPLAKHLDPQYPLYGFQDTVDNPTKIETMAEQYLAEMQNVQPQGPYYLAGVCSGGTIAFEMAQQLKKQGEQVGLLALIEPAYPSRSTIAIVIEFFDILSRNIWQYFWQNTDDFGNRTTIEKQAFVRLKLKLVANLWALRQYMPQNYHGTLDLFLTTATLKQPRNQRIKWQAFALLGATVHEIPGDHNTITGTGEIQVEETHMKVVAEKINGQLSKQS
ncbi:MAG: thioesterase domain-containing protein, partial [Chloroflexota bacterium]